ncbi:uncharacterized protein isoform X4 [Macaca fascicularis]|uniref:uncharacterized protein isoform X4 n=1 Tax=Macaca fascicularis TaxID=9541 RepID=UPI003D15ED87
MSCGNGSKASGYEGQSSSWKIHRDGREPLDKWNLVSFGAAGGSHRWSDMEEGHRLRWMIFVLGDSWRWWGAPEHVQHMWRGLLQKLVDPSGCSSRFFYEFC